MPSAGSTSIAITALPISTQINGLLIWPQISAMTDAPPFLSRTLAPYWARRLPASSVVSPSRVALRADSTSSEARLCHGRSAATARPLSSELTIVPLLDPPALMRAET